MTKFKPEEVDSYLLLQELYAITHFSSEEERNIQSPEILRHFFEQSESAQLVFPGFSPEQIKSVESNSPATIDVLFEDTSSITLGITPERYQRTIESYQEAKRRGTLDQDLPKIVSGFLREYQSGMLLRTLSPENFTSATDSEDQLYFSFGVPFSPWVQLQFSDSGISVRGGPLIYAHLEEDAGCDLYPSFYQVRELDFALSELAKSDPNVRKQTQVQEEPDPDDVLNGLVIGPARFPKSSATEDKISHRDFEVREEVVPVTALPDVLSYLRDSHQITAKPIRESGASYSNPVFHKIFQQSF
ncbi:hypothetical protein KY331_03215 [Candidatus Woesearchaeota archaeon]|nr:hypothetical protein [Candidatus Woesearchaeota archaeon]